MKRIDIGIIGCGNISHYYLKVAARSELVRVKAVADVRMEAAEAKAAERRAGRHGRSTVGRPGHPDRHQSDRARRPRAGQSADCRSLRVNSSLQRFAWRSPSKENQSLDNRGNRFASPVSLNSL